MSFSLLLLTIVQKQLSTHECEVNSGEHKMATNTFRFKAQFIQLQNPFSDFADKMSTEQISKMNSGQFPFLLLWMQWTRCQRSVTSIVSVHTRCHCHPHPTPHKTSFFGSKIKYNYKLLMKNYVKGSSIIYYV